MENSQRSRREKAEFYVNNEMKEIIVSVNKKEKILRQCEFCHLNIQYMVLSSFSINSTLIKTQAFDANESNVNERNLSLLLIRFYVNMSFVFEIFSL